MNVMLVTIYSLSVLFVVSMSLLVLTLLNIDIVIVKE